MSDAHSRHGWLPRFSVDRPVTVLMTLLAVLVLGVIAYLRIPIAMFPEGLDEKRLNVYVRFPNATPTDVELNVARPIEAIVGTIPGVRSTRSYANAGFCYVGISFQNDVDLRDAYAEVRDRMDRIMPEMPEDIDRIYVRRFDENDIPIIEASVQVPPDREDVDYLLETIVQPALQRIDGVGNVDIFGYEGKDLIIELNQDRVAAHGIDVARLISRLRGQDENLPGGWVIEGGRKFFIRSIGRYTDVEEVANIIIDPTKGLRLRDIATVSYKAPKMTRIFRVGGQQAVGIEIQRTSGANIVKISRAVHQTFRDLEAMPELDGLKFQIRFDQGRHVQESVDNLRNSGLWGGLFAAIVLFLFLRAPRMTTIVTLAIPLSLLMTVVVLYFIDWSLNMVTMMGLLLSIGLVVDNSIVIIENIYRKRQEGVEARRASIEGTAEVGLAIVMATLTTIVVFLPLLLMSGGREFTFYMIRLGVPVICSLAASLFIALIFIPLAALKLSRGTRHHDLRLVSWLRRLYLRILDRALNHRTEAALLIVAAMATIVIPYSKVERPRNGGRADTTVRLFIETPSGYDIEQTLAELIALEKQILARSEELGIERLDTRSWSNRGRIYIQFSEPENTDWYAVLWRKFAIHMGWKKPRLTKQELEKTILDSLQTSPGVIVRTSRRGDAGGGDDEASASVVLYGEDTETLVELAREVERRLATIPGVFETETELERGQNELQIRLDRDRTRRLGVEAREVSMNISNTLRGLRLSRYRTPEGREVDMTVQLKNADDATLQDVRRLTFRNRAGEAIPLEALAELSVSRSLGQIRRENRQTALRVTAKALTRDARTLFASIDTAMAGFELPRGYRWDKGEGFRRMRESEQDQAFAVLMAVTFVFLLMGILFESFVLPMAVIVAVPFAFLGVFWTLFLTGTPLDQMSGIGVVILIGVVVNNAIVLVDLINRLREGGMPRREAIRQAAAHRFRPIMMTSFTTACGLIPMALGESKIMGFAYAPLGRTMMGGLLAATFLTLIIVPLTYTLLDDLRRLAARTAATAIGTPDRKTDSPSRPG